MALPDEIFSLWMLINERTSRLTSSLHWVIWYSRQDKYNNKQQQSNQNPKKIRWELVKEAHVISHPAGISWSATVVKYCSIFCLIHSLTSKDAMEWPSLLLALRSAASLNIEYALITFATVICSCCFSFWWHLKWILWFMCKPTAYVFITSVKFSKRFSTRTCIAWSLNWNFNSFWAYTTELL